MDTVRHARKIPLFSADVASLLTNGPLHLVCEDHMPQEIEENVGQLATVRQPTTGETSCLACDVAFTDRDSQVDHYHLDWHRLNLKRRLESLPPLTQEEFESEVGDLSSISGSDSESDVVSPLQGLDDENEPDQSAANLRGSPLIHFKTGDGAGHAVFKCVLIHTKVFATDVLVAQEYHMAVT